MPEASRPELAETVQKASQEQIHEVGQAFLWLCNQDAFLIDPPLTPATLTHAVHFDTPDSDVVVRLDPVGGLVIHEHSVVAYEDRLHKRVSTFIVNGSGATVEKPRYTKSDVTVQYYQQNEPKDPVIEPAYGNPEDWLKSLRRKHREKNKRHMPGIQATLGDMFSVAHHGHLLRLADQFSMASVLNFGEAAMLNKGSKREE